MRSNNKRITDLAHKWRRQKITDAEKQEFDNWYNNHDDTYIEENTNETVTELKYRLYRNILDSEHINTYRPKPLVNWRRLSVAASLLLMLSAGGWVLWQRNYRVQQQKAMAVILPGGNKAILTLANGQQIMLIGKRNGNIAHEGNTLINKTADGSITYQQNSNKTEATAYNTIATPPGGQYRVTLADGTHVLLNASSSLKYPAVFANASRDVELSGEAYFEVVHNPAHPFRVKTAGQTIEDIGTQFNVNAYADEPDNRTTLIEGSVRVFNTAQPQGSILKPGQQAVSNAGIVTVKQIDTEQAVAWKNGYFMFESEKIESIMRRVARWYNVEIVYDGPAPSDKFGGEVNRFENVSQLLNKLELTGRVHFKVEGRRIMVSR